MNYPRIFFIFGLAIALIPFLGIPLIWKHILTVLAGGAVIAFAILLRSALRGKKPARAASVSPVRRTRTASQPKKSLANTMQAEQMQMSEPQIQPEPEVVIEEALVEEEPRILPIHDES